MKTYLATTNYGTYKYVRRVPKLLLEYTSTASFRVSLGSNILEATQTALSYNNAVDEAIQLISLGISSDVIISKLNGLIPKDKIADTATESPKQGLFLTTASEYLSAQAENISVEETRDKGYFYKEVCSAIFKELGLTDNPLLSDLNYNHLLRFRDIIARLPKRNIQKYRDMNMSQILKNIKAVEGKDKLSARTVNKYIKWLRALFNFAVVLNQLQVNLANSLPLQKTIDDKLQRLPLDQFELNRLVESIPQQMQYLLQILAYTGMRLSELYKCTLTEIDGYKCFSLTDRDIKLKTKSSYRVIPIHDSLLEQVEHFYQLRALTSSDNLARTTSATIKKLEFKSKEKKSLYSLRHTFATTLIQRGADASVVSELMGHSHTTMTLSRYSTGFSIKQLKEVIETL